MTDAPENGRARDELLRRLGELEEEVRGRHDRRAFFTKLRAAQAHAQAVQAVRTTESGPRFRYASEEDVVEHLRKVLLLEGLVLTASAELLADEIVDVGRPNDPKRSFRSQVQVRFQLTDSATGYSESWSWPGVAMDSQDRSARKAASDARKPFLLNLLFTYTTEDNPPDPLRFTDDDPPQDPPAAPEPSAPAGGDQDQEGEAEDQEEKVLRKVKAKASELKKKFQVFEVEAVVRCLDLPEDRKSWNAGHYQQIVDELKRGQTSVRKALDEMAKREPISDSQRDVLDALTNENGAQLSLTDRGHIESAKGSGWAWAVDFWLERLKMGG